MRGVRLSTSLKISRFHSPTAMALYLHGHLGSVNGTGHSRGRYSMTSMVLVEDVPTQKSAFDSGGESMTAAAQTEPGPVRKKGKVQKSLRDRIVLDHLPLVKAIAVR